MTVAATSPTVTPAVPITIVGNGMVAVRLIEELRSLHGRSLAIRVFGAEAQPGYNRVLLSPLLAGDLVRQDLITHDFPWYAAQNVDLRVGCPIETIDRVNRRLVDRQGQAHAYDTLVLATGSQPAWLAVPGANLSGVHALRHLGDVAQLHQARAVGGQRAVVIGGGLLGLEAACGLTQQGWQTTVVHVGPRLLDRQLDPGAAALLQGEIEGRGVRCCLAAQTRCLHGDQGRVTAVELADGRQLPADVVVIAIGIRPEIGLAQAAGLDCGRGIRVDDALRSSDPQIFALGECAEHRGMTYGLLEPLWEQARVAAKTLTGQSARYSGSVPSAKLKVSGVHLFSVGVIGGETAADAELVLQDPSVGLYRKLVVRHDRLVGAVLYGEVADGPWFAQLIRDGVPITAWRDRLIFGMHACAGRAA